MVSNLVNTTARMSHADPAVQSNSNPGATSWILLLHRYMNRKYKFIPDPIDLLDQIKAQQQDFWLH